MSPDSPATAPAPATAASSARGAQQRINGVYDLPAPGRIAGWAIDRADPEACVEVVIRREGRTVARVRADNYRPDLEKGGIGTGRYGFSVEIDPPLAPGMGFTVTADAIASDGAAGPLRATGAARPGEDPERALLERLFLAVTAMQAGIDRLGTAVAAPAADPGALAATLARVEVVQARLELALAAVETPRPPRPGPGLRAAVGLALTLGAAALALGLWSVFGG